MTDVEATLRFSDLDDGQPNQFATRLERLAAEDFDLPGATLDVDVVVIEGDKEQ